VRVAELQDGILSDLF